MSENRVTIRKEDELILYSEVDGICPLCLKSLIYDKDGKNYKEYEIAHIFPLNPKKVEVELLKDEERLSKNSNDLSNLICLCTSCHTKFDKPRNVSEYRLLVEKKKNLQKQRKYKEILIDTKIENEIIQIIETLYAENKELYEDDILNYDPKTIDEKVNDTITLLTKRKIHLNVQDYFFIIKNKFVELDKITPTTTELISSQVRTHYLLLKRQTNNQKEIFDALVDWITKRTNQNNYEAAEIIVSYFIQNCEVFE
jgi:HNH endonuclease.